MNNENKALFFGIEAVSPWPTSLPQGRLIHEKERHATLAFLGKSDLKELTMQLNSFPLPPFKAGLAGVFDKCLFLPMKRPHVVCWRVDFAETLNSLEIYQKTLSVWLNSIGFPVLNYEDNLWLPHVTIARQPFEFEPWKKYFTPHPAIFKAIHLYQSIGNLRYSPVWSFQLAKPWIEIEHTADIAFLINGESLQQIYRHALLALAFKFPQLLLHLPKYSEITSLDDIVILLNNGIALCDRHVGCLFKAVCFHGELEKHNSILHWEMIVDV